MNMSLQRRIELFDKNNQVISKRYKARNVRLQVLCSFICSSYDMEIDIEVFDSCREILRNHFGLFSSARENLELPLLASMAVSGDPEDYACRLKNTYELVKKGTFLSGDFEMLAAMILMDAPEGRVEQAVDRMKSIYKKMDKNHPWLTDSSDKSSAAILALSNKDEDILLSEMEACFTLLKARFKYKGDKVQNMSAILAAAEGSPEEKCAKTIELCEKLKENKMNLNMSIAMPMVACLALLPEHPDTIIEGVAEAVQSLKGRPCFGAFALGEEGRIIYGIANYLVCSGRFDDSASSLIQSQILNVVMQEIVLMMIIIASTQTTSNSSH